MRMLLWDVDNRFIVDQHGEISLEAKPELSFDFVAVRYVENGEFWSIDSNSARNDLGLEQVQEILDYIKSKREAYGIKVMAVDVHGEYLGWVNQNDTRIDSIVSESPPNGDEWNWCNGVWVRVWYLNANKQPTIKEESVERVFSNSFPKHFTDAFDESTDTWVSTVDIGIHKLDGLSQFADKLIDKICDNVVDRESLMTDIIASILVASKPYLTEVQHTNLLNTSDVILDEIKNYCDNVDDVRLSVMNLDVYT